MRRTLTVAVDANTFPGSQLPSGFVALNACTSVDVLTALIHTALRTRSPVTTGLRLSDYWAWLRYSVAVDNCPDLRLCSAWDDVDPHQKTILSDEVGVGITTCFLAEVLGYKRFVDTHYVVKNANPASVLLKPSSKRGPRKAPDYIAVDSSDGIVAIECKGTQSSLSTLKTAMKGGIGQKANVVGTSGARIKLGLVTGLFIPQQASNETATVLYWDPEITVLEQALEAISESDLHLGVVRGAVAKQLSLAGCAIAAKELAEERANGGPLTEHAHREIKQLHQETVVFDTHGWSGPDLAIPHATLSVKVADSTIRALLSEHPEEKLLHLSRSWTHEEHENEARVDTADGFTFSLKVYR